MKKQRITITLGPGSIIGHTWDGKHEFEGLLDVQIEDLERYVQVKFPGSYKSYTYRDPFGDLFIGDLVDVPTRREAHNVATVVAVGKADWSGYIHDVNARYIKETP